MKVAELSCGHRETVQVSEVGARMRCASCFGAPAVIVRMDGEGYSGLVVEVVIGAEDRERSLFSTTRLQPRFTSTTGLFEAWAWGATLQRSHEEVYTVTRRFEDGVEVGNLAQRETGRW